VTSVSSENVVQESGARLTRSAPTPTQIVVLLAAVFALAWQINESETEEDGVSGARRADDDEHQSDSSGETANRDQDDAPDEHHSAEDRLDGCGVRAFLVGQGPPRRSCTYWAGGAAPTCHNREPTCLKPLIATSTVRIDMGTLVEAISGTPRLVRAEPHRW
jgi:hypothetical protein